MRVSKGEDVACYPNRANGEQGLFQRLPTLPAETRNQKAEPCQRSEFGEGERCARQRGGRKILGVLVSCDLAIFATKRIGLEIGNSTFREWGRGGGSTLQAEERGLGSAGDASLFGGPFPPQELGHSGQRGHSRGAAGARGRPLDWVREKCAGV